MDFRDFQRLNRRRCEEAFGHIGFVSDPWDLSDWALAICGEAGELANLAKKVRRGDYTLAEKREEILREVADVMTYCDILMSYLEADTGRMLMQKFGEVSKRVNWAGSW